MKQTNLRTGTALPSPNENISISIGLVGTVEHYLGKVGILDFVDGFKMKGVPMSRILISMCTHTLMGNNSMSRCSEWLKDTFVRKELGLDGGLSQRTIS